MAKLPRCSGPDRSLDDAAEQEKVPVNDKMRPLQPIKIERVSDLLLSVAAQAVLMRSGSCTGRDAREPDRGKMKRHPLRLGTLPISFAFAYYHCSLYLIMHPHLL